MKKICLFVFVLSITSIVARAQHDTLPYYVGVPQFYMEHQLQGALRDTTHDGVTCKVLRGNLINGNLFQGHSEDRVILIKNTREEPGPLHVIGIAAPFVDFLGENSASVFNKLPLLYEICAHRAELYDSICFRVYQPIGDSMILLESVVLDTTFDTSTCRFYRADKGWDSVIPANLIYPHLNPVMEVYFDNEILFHDSLYFSLKAFSDSLPNFHMVDITTVYHEGHTPYSNTYQYPEFKFKDFINGQWYDNSIINYIDFYNGYPLLWPIIRRDCDTCPTVQGLEYVKTGYNRAFFRWQNGTNHHDWQLSYGPAGTAPEDGTIVDCSQRMTGTIEFDPDSHNVAYVRARCRFARYEYGPWSAPLDFCLNGNGIDEAGAAAITLTPNPAAERVTVAAEGMENVELIGADGAVLQRKECRGECVLDLRGLAAGIYMVRVGTAQGTATKRLVVQ